MGPQPYSNAAGIGRAEHRGSGPREVSEEPGLPVTYRVNETVRIDVCLSESAWIAAAGVLPLLWQYPIPVAMFVPLLPRHVAMLVPQLVEEQSRVSALQTKVRDLLGQLQQQHMLVAEERGRVAALQADIQDLLVQQQQRHQQLVEEKQRRMRELKAEVQALLEQQQRQLLSAGATDRVDTEHRAEVERENERELAALRGQLQLQQGHSEMLLDDVAELRRQLLAAEGQARARAARAEELSQLLLAAEVVQEKATQAEQTLGQELRASRAEVEVLRGQCQRLDRQQALLGEASERVAALEGDLALALQQVRGVEGEGMHGCPVGI